MWKVLITINIQVFSVSCLANFVARLICTPIQKLLYVLHAVLSSPQPLNPLGLLWDRPRSDQQCALHADNMWADNTACLPPACAQTSVFETVVKLYVYMKRWREFRSVDIDTLVLEDTPIYECKTNCLAIYLSNLNHTRHISSRGSDTYMVQSEFNVLLIYAIYRLPVLSNIVQGRTALYQGM